MSPILCSANIEGMSDATSKARFLCTRRCQEVIVMRLQSANWLRSRRKHSLAHIRGLLAELAVILANQRIHNSWESSASGIYRNWLRHISARERNVLVPKRLKAMADSEELLGAPCPPAFLLGDVG